eukprot:1989658-Pleurochrysis_carterae.AAC.1
MSGWLAGATGELRIAKRHASLLRMVGVCDAPGAAEVAPRAVAQFIAAAAGDMAAVDAVEAALGATLAADEAGPEGSAGAHAPLADAGMACASVLREALDALGADGAMEVMEENAAMQAAAGVAAGPAACGAFAAEALATRVSVAPGATAAQTAEVVASAAAAVAAATTAATTIAATTMAV